MLRSPRSVLPCLLGYVPEERLEALLQQLERARLVLQSADGEWALARDLSNVTLHDLYRMEGFVLPEAKQLTGSAGSRGRTRPWPEYWKNWARACRRSWMSLWRSCMENVSHGRALRWVWMAQANEVFQQANMFGSLRLRALLVIVLGLVTPFWVHAETVEFGLPDLDGKLRRLSEFRGKWVLVNYWATWCPPCLEELPELEVFHVKHQYRDAVVIGVNLEDIDLARLRLCRKSVYQFPSVA